MGPQYPLIDSGEIAPESAVKPDQSLGHLRLAVTAAQGSSTTAYHLTAKPGAGRPEHVVDACDQLALLVRGEGMFTLAGEQIEVRAGHCLLIPKGCPRAFTNTSREDDALIVGFYPGAGDLRAAGYRETGAKQTTPFTGVVVHLDDVARENMAKGDGWQITDFRLPLGAHNGSGSTLFRARFFPGAIHNKHRHDNCEEIYYVISGSGIAGAGEDRVVVRAGHFHYIPRGVEHWLHNLSKDEPIEVVGIYIGAGSVAATGYVYMGEVTEQDLEGTGEGKT